MIFADGVMGLSKSHIPHGLGGRNLELVFCIDMNPLQPHINAELQGKLDMFNSMTQTIYMRRSDTIRLS